MEGRYVLRTPGNRYVASWDGRKQVVLADDRKQALRLSREAAEIASMMLLCNGHTARAVRS